jgi:histidinol-phosphate aminotransferase
LSCDFYQLSHPGIQSLQPYIPGKSIESLAREKGLTEIIKLASNENPLGCSSLVCDALAAFSKHQLAGYPAPLHHPLHAKLSSTLSVHEDCLTLGNGSDLLFFFLLTAFALHTGKHILTHELAFLSYAVQAQTLGIPVIKTPIRSNWEVDIDAMIQACTEETAIIFLANPNNPTGLLIPPKEIERLVNHIPESTLLVLDEAYYEFAYAKDDNSSLLLWATHPNLVITRTFSKAYGLAGLRLGYAIAHPAITDLLRRVQPPFVVNQASLLAAYTALDDLQFIDQTLVLTRDGLAQLRKGLDALHVSYLPSHCNFITIHCPVKAELIYGYLLEEGIIVRPLTQYGLSNHLRISVGTARQNAQFLDKLAMCLAQQPKEFETE